METEEKILDYLKQNKEWVEPLHFFVVGVETDTHNILLTIRIQNTPAFGFNVDEIILNHFKKIFNTYFGYNKRLTIFTRFDNLKLLPFV
jgi:uncharacterized protein YpiB (UPF0302 family)